jgi:Double zinc ribbon
MSTKKKLITRMALGTGAILAAALLAGGVCLALLHADEERWREAQKRERQQAVERSRQYLGELAKKIDKLPVNPTLIGEIEARYFEERTGGVLHAWAMGTGGEFLFGVPRESFSRLNAVYDREVTPRLKEGIFFDRQAFFLGHLDAGEDLGLPDELTGDGKISADLSSLLRRQEDRSGRSFVLSAPLKTADGVALGSLYLKREAGEPEWYRRDERKQVVAAVAGGLAVVSFTFLWILLPTWVYVDGTERGVRRARLFAFLTVLSSLIGLVVYLISRPEGGKALACPGCAREVNGGSFCPHCGRDLSAAFCATCRYPLKPEWAFCPSCRTEAKAPPLAEAPAAG